MTERTLKLLVVDGETPHVSYLPEEYRAAGFEYNYEFDTAVVVFSFRLSMGQQHTPIRVWFRKDEVAESQWYEHARMLALELAGLPR